MNKSEWNDKQLEERLKQLPKIKDHREPEDIYQKVLSKLEDNKDKQKKQLNSHCS